jgi:hypothetical protein
MMVLLPALVLAIAEPDTAPAATDLDRPAADARTVESVAATTTNPATQASDASAAVDPRWAALVRLREEVGTLASDVEADRASAQAEIAALEKRKHDLEGDLDAVRAKARAIDALDDALTDQSGARTPDVDRDAVVAAIADGRAHLATSIPFDLAARTALLDDAERALAVGSVMHAADLTWRFLARERALAHEVGLAREPVTLGDKRVMADVVHVGLVAMYARTRGGTLAIVKRDGEVARGEVVSDPDARAGLLALFEATKGGPPRGLFMVPR